MKRKSLIIALMFCISMILAGCGYNYKSGDVAALEGKSEEQIEQNIIVKKSTKQDVLAYLGKPGQKTKYGGQEMWTYTYNNLNTRGGMGWSRSSSEHTFKTVTVKFDGNGVVEDLMTNFSEHGTSSQTRNL